MVDTQKYPSPQIITPVVPERGGLAVIIAIAPMDAVDIMTSGNLSPEVVKTFSIELLLFVAGVLTVAC